MAVLRRGTAQQLQQIPLPRGGGEQIAAPHHLGHPHPGVVHHHCQLVGVHPVGPAQNEVSTVPEQVFLIHPLEQVPEGAGTVRHRQAPGGVPLPGQILPLFRRQPPAPPVIHRLSIRAVGGGSRHPLRPGAEAGIDQPLLLQLPEGRLIGRGPPALVHRLVVPVQPQPP